MIHIRLSRREKYIFIIAIGVIIISMAYNFIFEHLFKKWEALNSEIIAKRVKFNKEIRLLENRNSSPLRFKHITKI